MQRRAFLQSAVAGPASSLLLTAAGQGNEEARRKQAKNIVFVHGLFADGSCWLQVIARLQAQGFHCTSVQNPLTTLPDAVAAAKAVLDEQDGPTVFVGHSFAGVLISEAGLHPNVSALVYVAARAPDAGEDYAALAKRYPSPPATAGIVFRGNAGKLSEAAFVRDFAGDLPEANARSLHAVQQPFQKSLVNERTTQAAWHSKPTYYAISTEDRTIDPDLQRFLARRMKAVAIEVRASHLSLLSQPDVITQLIVQAANAAGVAGVANPNA